MGMMDKATSKATEKAKGLKDKAMDAVSDEHVDKAADKIDEMTGHQHSDKIDKGRNMAKDHLDPNKGEPTQ